MEKHIKIFCEQNPDFEVKCNNPNCKHKGTHVFRSKDVFQKNSFEFLCEDQKISVDVTAISKSLKKAINEMNAKY